MASQNGGLISKGQQWIGDGSAVFKILVILLMDKILHQLIGSISHYRLYTSQVVQDFSHQQYFIDSWLVTRDPDFMAYDVRNNRYRTVQYNPLGALHALNNPGFDPCSCFIRIQYRISWLAGFLPSKVWLTLQKTSHGLLDKYQCD